MEDKGNTYIFLTCQRKAWHFNSQELEGWGQVAFERFNFVECGVFVKPTAELNEYDKMLVTYYGEPNEDFRSPSDWKGPK